MLRWKLAKIGEICETGAGGTPLKSHKEYYEGGTIPWLLSGEVGQGAIYTVKNFITQNGLKNSSAKIFPEETVLIAMYGATAGEVGVLKIASSTNQAVCAILPNEVFLPKFLYYYFLYKKDFLISQAVGGAQPNISQEKIRNIDIPLVPIPEQQRIVRILDEAFDAIAIAKVNTEKNLQNTRDLFESCIQNLFTHHNEGCVDQTLGNICDFVRGPFGGSLKKSIFTSEGYAVYEQQHAIYDQFSDIRYFIDEKKFNEMKRFEIFPNDLIMSCSGTMGRVAIVPAAIKRGIINQALLKLTPKAVVLNSFLKYWMESTAFQDALKEFSSGAAIQNVASVKVIKEIKIPLPSIEEQKKVVEKINRISFETDQLENIYNKKLIALDALKKSILHSAFSGEL